MMGARARVFATCLMLLAASASVGAVGVGEPAPACALTALGAAPALDTAAFRGRVVYLDFWASWCAPCAQSFPFLGALQREYRDRGLMVIGVNVDEKAADAMRFIERVPTRFTVAADAEGRCPRSFGVEAMPSAYLIDRAGRVRHVHAGFRTSDAADLRRRVEQLLSEGAGGVEPPGGKR